MARTARRSYWLRLARTAHRSYWLRLARTAHRSYGLRLARTAHRRYWLRLAPPPFAAHRRNVDMVKLLLGMGAIHDLKTPGGKTAVDVCGDEACTEVLTEFAQKKRREEGEGAKRDESELASPWTPEGRAKADPRRCGPRVRLHGRPRRAAGGED